MMIGPLHYQTAPPKNYTCMHFRARVIICLKICVTWYRVVFCILFIILFYFLLWHGLFTSGSFLCHAVFVFLFSFLFNILYKRFAFLAVIVVAVADIDSFPLQFLFSVFFILLWHYIHKKVTMSQFDIKLYT